MEQASREQASRLGPLPAEYYRRHAARVRRLASEATTPGIKEHLREVAVQYERMAERVEHGHNAPSA